MALPPKLKKKYLDRLDELIRRGESIEIQRQTKTVRNEWLIGREPSYFEAETINVDYDAFRPWRASCVTPLEHVLPKNESHAKWLKVANNEHESAADLIPWLVDRLRSVREDLELGFFDDLGERIEGEIAADYMGQAETLLGECESEIYSYVPAAVLAGAVLERHLRELCAKQSPPIDTSKSNGRPKTLDPLIADLKSANVLTAPQAAQLRGHASIRNKAAHGEWDEFNRADVENMVQGVKNALAFTVGS